MDFEAAFGTHPNVTMTALSNKDPAHKPNIKISNNGAIIEFYMDIFIKNPIDPNFDAARMVTKAVTSLQLFINDNFLLWGTIKDLKLNVIEYNPYFKT